MPSSRVRQWWVPLAVAVVVAGLVGGVWRLSARSPDQSAAAVRACPTVGTHHDEDGGVGYAVVWRQQRYVAGTDALLEAVPGEVEQVGEELPCAVAAPPGEPAVPANLPVGTWSGFDPRCRIAVPVGERTLVLRAEPVPRGVDCDHQTPGPDGVRMRLYLHCGAPPVQVNGNSWVPERGRRLPRANAGAQLATGTFSGSDDGHAQYRSDLGWTVRYRLRRAGDPEWFCA